MVAEQTMSEQRTLASVVYDTKRKVTRRERFLREMDAVIPSSCGSGISRRLAPLAII